MSIVRDAAYSVTTWRSKISNFARTYTSRKCRSMGAVGYASMPPGFTNFMAVLRPVGEHASPRLSPRPDAFMGNFFACCVSLPTTRLSFTSGLFLQLWMRPLMTKI